MINYSMQVQFLFFSYQIFIRQKPYQCSFLIIYVLVSTRQFVCCNFLIYGPHSTLGCEHQLQHHLVYLKSIPGLIYTQPSNKIWY